mmetsp:Transcript_96/g.275  ORF Transcript_96/g.275 Transcript_96/m.275 type:complete len:153 (+) Transcript_96:59-517(+)
MMWRSVLLGACVLLSLDVVRSTAVESTISSLQNELRQTTEERKAAAIERSIKQLQQSLLEHGREAHEQIGIASIIDELDRRLHTRLADEDRQSISERFEQLRMLRKQRVDSLRHKLAEADEVLLKELPTIENDALRMLKRKLTDELNFLVNS